MFLQALRPSGSLLVQVQALTLRKHRCFCASVGSARVRPGTHGLDTGFVTAHRARLDRADSGSLSRYVHREAGDLRVTWPPLVPGSAARPAGYALFTGTWRVSSRRCATGTMQTRASSTKRDPGEDQTAGNNNKGEEQNLKEAKAPGEPEPEGGKPNKTQQLKKVFKEYGAVGVSFHICISLMSLGMFYLLISSGIDMTAVLCKLGFSEAVVQSKMAAGTSTFVLAYAVHKLFAPVRISITLVSVPLIVRYFRKTGLFKPPTPAP